MWIKSPTDEQLSAWLSYHSEIGFECWGVGVGVDAYLQYARKHINWPYDWPDLSVKALEVDKWIASCEKVIRDQMYKEFYPDYVVNSWTLHLKKPL